VRAILLNPGPVSLSDGVRRAVTRVDLCHREPEFFELQDEVIRGLVDIYQNDPAQWIAVLVGGSGTSAMEAMMVSLLPVDANVLVLENGVYGERLSRISSIYGIRHQALKASWGEVIDLQALAELLASGDFTHVLAVHHETTTGRLNPVDEIASLCTESGVKLLLDAVSSFGAESIPFAQDSLQAIAATANKCLHGIPGLAMVLCRREALKQDIAPRSLSLHLPAWQIIPWSSSPLTTAKNSMKMVTASRAMVRATAAVSLVCQCCWHGAPPNSPPDIALRHCADLDAPYAGLQ
jgi:2-aminoethylphosphonate-pyruvate transaminase